MLKICGKVLESGSKIKCSLGPEGYPMPGGSVTVGVRVQAGGDWKKTE